MNKRTELESSVELYKPIAIGITEVKPKNTKFDIQAGKISLNEYERFPTLNQTLCKSTC